jgi:hypothetical protein
MGKAKGRSKYLDFSFGDSTLGSNGKKKSHRINESKNQNEEPPYRAAIAAH